MIPQHPCNNEVLWEGIESAVRDLAFAEGEIYIVTGPIYEGADIPFLNGRVGVPSRVYKAVYDPVRRTAAAYVTPNADGRDWQAVSIDQLAQITGIDPSRRYLPRSRRWRCRCRPRSPISVVVFIDRNGNRVRYMVSVTT